MMKITEKQREQLAEKRISAEELDRQLERFRTGMKYSDLVRPATAGDGIIVLDEGQKSEYLNLFEKAVSSQKVVRFVPASGAATRMFKDLFEFLVSSGKHDSSMQSLPAPVQLFADNLTRMPFFKTLKGVAETETGGLSPADNKGFVRYIELLLGEEGMNYGNLPKALLEFHCYNEEVRMAFEEHLVEWALLLKAAEHSLNIHFTLSPQHLPLFEEELNRKSGKYENRFRLKYDISCSVQDSSTDTVAATVDNLPFTDQNGDFIFRPGGHGALLYNLNGIDTDVIFIKNIDNVAREDIEKENLAWKKNLGGLLIDIKTKIHTILDELESGNPGRERLTEVADFISSTFRKEFDPGQEDITNSIYSYLDRPIRVCGMVKNTGEPGGGPFWVRSGNVVSLQIVESAQINMDDPEQKSIAGSATHFNPVDLVCAVKDHKGKKFDLNLFSDPETSFISEKSHQGKVLKALEHPGLWNGAMANWLTLFVEVPLITFNPVKTVNDLLRPEHKGCK